MHKLGIASCLGIVVCALAAPARAQSSDADRLFQKGVEAMRAADYATACPLIEESYRLDPVPGALFTLAECESSSNKLVSAVAHYRAFLATVALLPAARRDRFEERRKIAVEKIATVTVAMPAITIDVAGSAVVVVKRNDVFVDPGSYGVTQKLDPGDYLITAEGAAGKWERRLRLNERDHVRVTVPSPLPSAEPAAQAAPAPAAIPLPARDRGERAAPPRGWVFVAGGIGVAGIATGTIAGLMALSSKSDIDANCPNHVCNPEGQRAVSNGKTASLVSTIAFPVGIAGLGTAAVILLVTKNRSVGTVHGVRPSIAGSASGAGLSVEGTF